MTYRTSVNTHSWEKTHPNQGRWKMIEHTDPSATYVYRVDPTDPHAVQRKRNTPGARWPGRPYRRYANPHDAKAAVFRLGRITIGPAIDPPPPPEEPAPGGQD